MADPPIKDYNAVALSDNLIAGFITISLGFGYFVVKIGDLRGREAC